MNGRGFAYFRWHSLQWEGVCGRGCRYRPDYLCFRMWNDMQSRLRRSVEYCRHGYQKTEAGTICDQCRDGR